MLRLTLIAAFALSTAPAFAGDPNAYPHTHGPAVVASNSVPINYRPLGKTYILRTNAYNAADTKIVRRARPGTSQNPTGDSVTEVFVTSPYTGR